MLPLPIDPVLPELGRALAARGAAVLEAPPGAGKTTRVPGRLLAEVQGEIIVAEPRRLAARMAAERVAEERGQRPGGEIGYTVRFEDVSSPGTRVRFVTEGVLLRRVVADPELRGVGAVVLDEFHERHLTTDLCLALVNRARRRTRGDLRLVVMSATLDGAPLAELLGAERVRSEGRMFPLTIEHQAAPDDRPLEKQVTGAVRRLIDDPAGGDVLVFLPGAGEIQRSTAALERLAREYDLDVLPLHGDLTAAEQTRAVRRGPRRKVVLATNVAESSITIDGVTGVVDAGLHRVATHSPWTGLPALITAKISRASAAQRAGRAGRTRPGTVVRLYTAGDLASRPERDAPELLRADLSESLLWLHGAGVRDPAALDWLDPPASAALSSARALLQLLGALDDAGELTSTGRELLELPVHPRLGRLAIEGARLGIAGDACTAAALLSERDLRTDVRAFGAGAHTASGDSDVSELIERFEEAEYARFDPGRLRGMGVDPRTARAVQAGRAQLRRAVHHGVPTPATADERERALARAVLRAFPDRVARRRRAGEREVTLSNGRSARLTESSVVRAAAFMVALDVEEQARGGAVVRCASALEPDWLLEIPGAVTLSEEHEVAPSGRIETVSRMHVGAVVLDESRAPARPSAEVTRVLTRAALGRAASLPGAEAVRELARRWTWLARTLPDLGLPELDEDPVASALAAACEGRTQLAELEDVDLAGELLARLSGSAARALAEHAPTHVSLPGGRRVAVNYELAQDPWIESRLQDFFGMTRTPEIARGRVALTVHLLAPNQRAVQVTRDLEGFWRRHYPGLRKELMRRYPRHAWPEDGSSATPPEPRRR